ncbi:MAG: sulfate adenylyltransferase [Deltaproteobacteria bacterium]|nr:sulfate adenylyltransferase [Deltaproteobacteria bacterium]
MAVERETADADTLDALRARDEAEVLRLVVVGSVDDGKSTLIGRLLYETGGLFEDQIAQVRRASRLGGELDFSLFTDGLRDEREQRITIDVAYRFFSTHKRHFIIADTPGHEQYTRNMATGASTAELAVILLDARLGVLPQSRRHAAIAGLLGIPRLAVAVNKMDLVGHDAAVFDAHTRALGEFASKLGFEEVRYFPVVAPQGDNLVQRSARMDWYRGPTLLEYLESVPVGRRAPQRPFRFPVQSVLRPDASYRGLAGRIVSGRVAVGDAVQVLPSGRRTTIAAIDTFEGALSHAFAPMSVTLRLAEEIDAGRGSVLASPDALPKVAERLEATLVWLSEKPLDVTRGYLVKHGARLASTRIEQVQARVELATLEEKSAPTLQLNDIGRVAMQCHPGLIFDPYATDRATGAFILIDAITNATVAAGTLLGVQSAPAPEALQSRVSAEARAQRLGHAAAVVELGAGRREQAYALEAALFDAGVAAVVVDDARAALACARAGLVALVADELPTSTRQLLADALGARLIDARVAADPLALVRAAIR